MPSVIVDFTTVAYTDRSRLFWFVANNEAVKDKVVAYSYFNSERAHSDFQDPSALAILLEKELVVVDLETPGYPCIELSYAMDIHDSPVTTVTYVLDSESTLFASLHQCSSHAKSGNPGFSKKVSDVSFEKRVHCLCVVVTASCCCDYFQNFVTLRP